jgi:hypothetical protein
MKRTKLPPYTFSAETAQRYLDKHGAAFVAALWNKSQTTRSIAEAYGYDYASIYILRKTLVPEEQRTIKAHKVTEEMKRAFKTEATNEELSKRFGIPYPTMERMRRRYVGKRVAEPLRLTPQALALLHSKFSNKRVAKALGLCSRTVWRHRVVLGITPLVTSIEVTDEQRAIIVASKNDQSCAEALGTTVPKARYMRFLHREGLL